MKTSTKDRIKGKFHEAKGDLKKNVGQVIDDPDLKAEGKSENLAGKIQKTVGKIEDVFEK